MNTKLPSHITATFHQRLLFALRLAIFFLISGYMLFHKTPETMKLWWTGGFVLVMLTASWPAFANQLGKALHALRLRIEKGLTFVLLVILYYAMITPLAWLARSIGKKFLEIKLDKGATTYWTQRADTSPSAETYEKPY